MNRIGAAIVSSMAALGALWGVGWERAGASGADALRRISRAELRVTDGEIGAGPGQHLLVEVPKVRAVVAGPTGHAAELRFTYLGPTEHMSALESGEARRQIGLKLRAQDSCNLAYVMWRIEPVSALVVSIKRNPGRAAHGDCGNGGYRNIQARRTAAVPAIEKGVPHVLRADLAGEELTVHVDGAVVWQGALGQEVFQFDGPVGMRADNGRFDIDFFAGGPG